MYVCVIHTLIQSPQTRMLKRIIQTNTPQCFVTVPPVKRCFAISKFITDQSGLDRALTVRFSNKIQRECCHLAAGWPTNETHQQ